MNARGIPQTIPAPDLIRGLLMVCAEAPDHVRGGAIVIKRTTR